MHWRGVDARGGLWVRWFVVIAGVFGLACVVATPILRGTDEPAHAARVALIDRGFLLPSTADVPPTDYHVDDCFTALLVNARLDALAETPPSWRAQYRNPVCEPFGDPVASAARTADVYSPVPYVPASIGFRVGRAVGGATGSVLGARLAQLAAYIALMAYAIARIPWGKPLLFVIGTLPVSIQGAANISADPLTLALACTAVALTVASVDAARAGPVPRGRVIALAATIAALMLCKSAYVPFALLILAVPTAAFGTWRRRIGASVATLGGAGLLAGAWNLGVVARIDIVGVNHSDSTLAAAWIRHHPIGFLESIVRAWTSDAEVRLVLAGLFTPVRRFAHNFPLPLWFGLAWLAVARLADPVPRLAARAVVGMRTRLSGGTARAVQPPAEGTSNATTARDPIGTAVRIQGVLVALAVGVATVLLVEYGLAIAANPPGTPMIRWVQGRYFLPLLPLTLLGVSGRVRPVRSGSLWLFPAVSAAVMTWWLVWVSGNLWLWF